MASAQVEVQVSFDNPENLEKFVYVLGILGEAVEDLPWRDDLREASELLEEITFTMAVS